MHGLRVENRDTGMAQDRSGESQLVEWIWVAENGGDVARTRAVTQCRGELGAAQESSNDRPPVVVIDGGAERRSANRHPRVRYLARKAGNLLTDQSRQLGSIWRRFDLDVCDANTWRQRYP